MGGGHVRTPIFEPLKTACPWSSFRFSVPYGHCSYQELISMRSVRATYLPIFAVLVGLTGFSCPADADNGAVAIEGVRASGSGLHLDGTGDYAAFPPVWASSPSEVTVEAWILRNPQLESSTIVYHGVNGEVDLSIVGGSAIRWSVKLADANWYRVLKMKVFEPYRWYHVAATWRKGKRLEIYIDGSLRVTKTVPDAYLWDPGAFNMPSIGINSRGTPF